mmetsp:Transcript_23526/g.55746  ORF Transcript_23526/g.55746 Transcript_23526/m.55746 type:complete len:258 (+) Transcript_23526:435-1208(+)
MRRGRPGVGVPISGVRRVLRQRARGRSGDRRFRDSPRGPLPLLQGLDDDHREGTGRRRRAARANPEGSRDGLHRSIPDPLAGARKTRRRIQETPGASGSRQDQGDRSQQLRLGGLRRAKGRRGNHRASLGKPDRNQPLLVPEKHDLEIPRGGCRPAVLPQPAGRKGLRGRNPPQDRRCQGQDRGPDLGSLVPPARFRVHAQVRSKGAHDRKRPGVRLRAIGGGNGGTRFADRPRDLRYVPGPVSEVRQSRYFQGRDP